jgi:hypothetical protein
MQRLFLSVPFTFSTAPKLRITPSMLLTRSRKTELLLTRGPNRRRVGLRIVGQRTTSRCIWIPQFEGFEVRQTMGGGKA